jgi:hypothetical protein
VVVLGALSTPASAQEAAPDFAVHGQTTYIWQTKPAFNAAYSGPNSLSPLAETSYSFTVTADLGLRLWQGAQLHLNPEGALGVPFSNLVGAGGISNGELARSGSPSLSVYRARFFLQQRIDLGGEAQTVESGFNELGGQTTARGLTLRVGNFSLLDYFDTNPYAKDPRAQFMNWSFLTHGAWDYAADSRGYTVGAMAEYQAPGWAVRFGRAMQPLESNGLTLDNALDRHYGDQLEVEGDLPVRVGAGPLRARALVFRNQVNAGSFADALALGGVPDVGLVRKEQTKTGWGLTLEVPLDEDAGLFVRASRNNGELETYAFAEIDRQLAIGGQFSGAPWARAQDRWGVSYAVNGLSDVHQTYLAAGGQGFFLGDGQLNYDSERVLEAYYRFALPDWSLRLGKLQSAVSAGFQWIVNPGYNRDRGPVTTYSLRWHSEF